MLEILRGRSNLRSMQKGSSSSDTASDIFFSIDRSISRSVTVKWLIKFQRDIPFWAARLFIRALVKLFASVLIRRADYAAGEHCALISISVVKSSFL